MNLVIMNYSGATVTFYTLPAGVEQSEDVESWIADNTEHRLSDIHYMTSETPITVIHE